MTQILPPYSEHEKEECESGRRDYIEDWGLQSFSHRDVRDMRRAEPDDELDLHGFTAREAHGQIEEFLGNALAEGYRLVDICHGKGAHTARGPGVLRILTRSWLSRSDAVVAFLTPDRNPGMVRVRLRRRR